MTIYYDEDTNEIVCNLAFHHDLGFARHVIGDDELVLEMGAIMDDGGVQKIRELRDAAQAALDANGGDE